MRIGRCGLSGSVLLGLLLLTESSQAQPYPALNLRAFEPSTAPGAMLSSESVQAAGPGNWNTSGWFSWAYRPVTLRTPDGELASKLVRQQTSFDLVAGLGLGTRTTVGLDIPAVLYQTGQSSTELVGSALPKTALGDLAVTGKVTLLPLGEMGGFGLAALARVTAPTGQRASYIADGAMTSELRLLAEYSYIALSVRATGGFKVRTEQRDFAGHTWGNEIPWGLSVLLRPQALGIDEKGRWTWALESHGWLPAGPTSPFTSEPLSPAFAGASARYAMGDVAILAGAEAGLTNAIGAPDVRGVLSVEWAPRKPDQDGDGVPDDKDECPELAEDHDGFEDSDGCPEADNDSDGVPDTSDKCPMQPEDLDDQQDDDGCPEGPQAQPKASLSPLSQASRG